MVELINKKKLISNSPAKMNKMWHIVVQIRKCNSVFCPNWLSNNNFVYIIKLIPVIISEKKRKEKKLIKITETNDRTLTQYCDL